MNLGVTELLIILGIVLLVFGSTRLPKLARSLGEASKEFKAGTEEPQKTQATAKPRPPNSPVAPGRPRSREPHRPVRVVLVDG